MGAADPSIVEPSELTRPLTALSVSVRDLDIRYRVYEEQRLTMRELFARGFRSRHATEVHAIKGVTFEITIGEAVGLIGRNGSGKSTLLRAIAGLQPKHGGQVLVRGEPHLLGVNAALKPELSGYRNVILGGLAMGIPLAEIQRRMDEVVEFSGLQGAMSRPMKTYSSGMRARLAFSIATLRVPEVLLIDEALAVGDREFRKRSLSRIRELRERANTVIMVTHNLNEIRETCSRTIWLDDGRIVGDGDTPTILEQYENSES
jgi:teichoic acid transport system ATP-binding protein